MTAGPVSWERVESVLDRTLGLPLHARAIALDQLCGTDTALRREVEALLTAHDGAGAFLETSAAEFASRHRPESAELADTTIGSYRLIEEIGRGGMGTIWLAERADGQFQQRVAVKLVKRGMDSDEILSRFARERQILARLEHPNIAHLLDGGMSPDGRPYFVMEYVKGAPITAYCESHHLGVDARLELFAQVCRAVHHAHRNLIVHRDLKPSNVMVADDGTIKLLDFGVAKLLADDEKEQLKTAPDHRGRPMTPEYASPEQVQGASVTTASDIYQLGVLLYELLAGERPFHITGRSAIEIERSICASLPAAPSSRAPEPVRKRLRGDLDAIVLRALEKEPEHRFPSAEALADDIKRHLANLPLRYPGKSRWYGAVKFARRHRAPLAIASGFTVLLLAVGTQYMLDIRVERDRARQGEATATESAALLRRFFQGWSPDAASRSEVSATRMLSDAGRRAEVELSNDPRTLASMLSMLGEMQATLGMSRVADSMLGRALAIQERLSDRSPELAATLARRGKWFLESGRHTEAEARLRRSLSILVSVRDPERTDILMVQFDLAYALMLQSKFVESEAVLRNAIRNSPSPDAPLSTELGSLLGYVLFHQGRLNDAVAILGPVLDRQRNLFGKVHHSTMRSARALASALRDQGKLDEAEALGREALYAARALYGADHAEAMAGLATLAIVLERQGEFVEAELLSREAARQSEQRYGANATTALHIRSLATIRMALGEHADAEQRLRRALSMLRESSPQGHPDEGDILNRLAYLAERRQAQDADSIYRDATRFEASRSASGPWFVTDGYEYLGEAARLRGDRVLARRMFERAVGLYSRLLPLGHSYRVIAEKGLKEVLPPEL